MGLYKAESDFESVLAETEAKASAVMGASPPSSVEELFEAKKVYAQTVFDCAFEERLKIATTPAQVEDAVAVMEDWLQSRLSEFVDLVLLGQEGSGFPAGGNSEAGSGTQGVGGKPVLLLEG